MRPGHSSSTKPHNFTRHSLTQPENNRGDIETSPSSLWSRARLAEIPHADIDSSLAASQVRLTQKYPVDRYPRARPVSGSVNNLVPNDLQSDCIFQTFFGNSALPKSILSVRYSRRPPCHTVRTYIISPRPLRAYVHSQANTKPAAPPPSTPTGYIICFCR